MTSLRDTFLDRFSDLTGLSPRIPDDYDRMLQDLCLFLRDQPLRTRAKQRAHFVATINKKFQLNRYVLSRIYSYAAHAGVTFSFLEKQALQLAADFGDIKALHGIIDAKVPDESTRSRIVDEIEPVTVPDTLATLSAEANQPSKLRIPLGDRDVGNQIALAALSAYVYSAASEQVMHRYFGRDLDSQAYCTDYYTHLQQLNPSLWRRDCTLMLSRHVVDCRNNSADYNFLRAEVLNLVGDAYLQLDNYGYLALYLYTADSACTATTWQLAEETKLYSERFQLNRPGEKYFSSSRIAAITQSHIPRLDLLSADFDIAQEGLTYRDCFVIQEAGPHGDVAPSLVLLFQKNVRDETPIPCPACRSTNIRGNSYSSLGVRSWECANPLCIDRSKYNRGKRYSFRGLLMQAALLDSRNLIPKTSIREWSRDVQFDRQPSEILKMLITFYSCHGDTIRVIGFGRISNQVASGRKIDNSALSDFDGEDQWPEFKSSPWFSRYVGPGTQSVCLEEDALYADRHNYRQYVGSSEDVLSLFETCRFDAIVTSPPYYNTKEYSNWPNIYCYLYDMKRVIEQCFRVLKNEAYVLFNVFDTFDNERSLAFSAMGQKKITLSSMLCGLFLDAGFQLTRNVVWDKGSIEGKRAYNGGNRSPYYQSPLNCWEHILVFVKRPGADAATDARVADLPYVLRAQPVVKMVRGRNILGHSAPFPEEIPLLVRHLCDPGAQILDPFSGSGTSARALSPFGYEVTCVERLTDYCSLAVQLFDKQMRSGTQLTLVGTG